MAMPHAQPGQPIRLAPLGDDIARAASHAILKTHALELIRLVLPAGESVPSHRLRGECTLFCIEGTIVVAGEEGPIPLQPGDLVLLPAGFEHAVQAVTAASALYTVQTPAGEPGSGSSTA